MAILVSLLLAKYVCRVFGDKRLYILMKWRINYIVLSPREDISVSVNNYGGYYYQVHILKNGVTVPTVHFNR